LEEVALNEEQKNRAIQIWHKYIEEGEHFINASQEYTHEQLDQLRIKIIPEVLAKIQSYLSGSSQQDEFKSQIDSINKRNRLWGFKGINGQMFFNMLTKVSLIGGKTIELDTQLKKSLPMPPSPELASKILDEFAIYTKSLSKYVDDLRAAPKIGAIPFFLSYFWQVQSPQSFPVYYTSMINVLQEYNLWSPTEHIGENYLTFYKLNHELLELFSKESSRKLTLWDVEHAFWFMTQPEVPPVPGTGIPPHTHPPDKNLTEIELPDSYIPPVVAFLSRLAVNDAELAKVCLTMGSNIEVVFEKRIDVLFKMLGYETEALGHGHGRVPDGVAICREFHYAIGYDAKVRQNPYVMGIDERAIREYIYGVSERMKKQGIRQIYFMVISSSFSGDHDDVIRSLKMDTDVREVLLVETSALVALLEAKLRDPLLTLGPEGVQRLLADSGILSEADVREFQGL
jgi:hypothetical protein